MKVYSVSQINNYIKRLFENDVFLQDIYIEAEISNFKAHSSGHFYMTLKDSGASVNAVMFRSYAEKLKFMPEDGMKVLINGYISLYEKTGQYQFYALNMEPAGKGALYIAYEQLKERLERSGVFDPKYKKDIPSYPKCIAVITSPTGAAVRDIINVSGRRNPNVKIVVIPVLVQGDDAAPSIANAIESVNKWGQADTIIVGRGGGSIEVLWAFNEEKVARAVAASSIPIISAVGHETDVTICDFVADCRAATPSAAAELAVPDQLELKDTLRSYQFTLTHLIRARMRNYHEQLHRLVASKSFQTPQTRVAMETMRLDRYTEQLSVAMKRKTEAEAHRLSKLSGQLHTLSPLQVLSRGYAIIQDKNQQTIKSTAQVCTGQQITVTLSDGVLDCTVDEVKCNE